MNRAQRAPCVRDLMTCPAPSAAPDASLERVAGLLTEAHTGAVPVATPDGLLLGLITEGDLLRDPGPREPVAASAMTAPLIAVGADQSPAEAHALMVRNRVHHLPVVDGAGRLVGMISRDGVAVGLSEDESEVRSAIVGVVRSCGGSIVALDVCEGVVRLHARVADACAARGLEQRVRVTPGVRVLIPTVECGGELSARGSRASR